MQERFSKWKQPVYDEDGYAYQEVTEAGYRHPYGWRCQHPGQLWMRQGVDIGCYTYLNAKHGIILGLETQIGSNCAVYSKSTIYGKYSGIRQGPIVIGDHVMIGAHSVIMPGVSIANDVIIAACSFVNKSIDTPGVLYGGVPAIELGHRRDCFGNMTVYKVRCENCKKPMSAMKQEDLIRGKLHSFFKCHTCGRMVSVHE